MIREGKAVWHGTGRAGGGNLSTESGVLTETPYFFKTRFENEKGTNPEELIAAARAGVSRWPWRLGCRPVAIRRLSSSPRPP
jgi:hypothetical protein